MAAEHPRQDSVQKKFDLGQSKQAGLPVMIVLDSIHLNHSESKIVKVGVCKYRVENFTAMVQKDVMMSYDYYDIYYVKGIGFIGAIFKRDGQLSPEWVRYQLEDIDDNKGHSITDKKALNALVKKTMQQF